MPKIIKTQLILGGNEFLPRNGYSATVEMAVGGHSAFTVTFPANATETYSGALMDGAIDHIGKDMYIGLADGAMEFTGLVTSVDLRKGTGSAGTMVISGQGPCAPLSGTLQCRSYEDGLPLSHVAADILQGHSAEIVRGVMGEGSDVLLPYTVQYNESDLSFLQRLCRRNGLWLYHDGESLRIGRTPGPDQVKGTYGTDITDFGLSTNLTAPGPGVAGRDWVGGDLLETPSGTDAPESPHPYFERVGRESGLALAKAGSFDDTARHGFSGQRGMDAAARVTAHAAAAGRVTAAGTTELVGLKVGDVLDVEGINWSDASERDTLGSYDVTHIVHRFDNSGHYSNGFRAVPEGTLHPPGSNGHEAAFAPEQRGRVLNNADPEGLGRVRVQFDWQRTISQSTPWIKTPTPYGGGGKGFYFVPEKGEEVLVGFEGGNPERPYVIGGGYNTSEKSGFYDRENNIKAIRTRSGNTIELNDTKGGEMITINDKEGNSIHINTSEGRMVFTAKGDMEFNAKNVRFNVQEDMDVEVGNDKRESIMGKTETSTKNAVENVSETKKVSIGKKLEQSSGELVMHTSQGKMLLDSKGKITVQSKEGTDYGK